MPALIRRLILASASPRRRELIAKLGLPWEAVAPEGIDESARGGPAFLRCQCLAVHKAEQVLATFPGAREEGVVVVGADTVVACVLGDREDVIGKPRDAGDARRILTLLSGKTHRVLTGVAVARRGQAPRVEAEVTLVSFRTLADQVIEEYLLSGAAEGKAGAYGIQCGGERLVEGIRGCYFNVAGLPLRLLARMLEVELPAPCGCESHPLQRGAGGCLLERR